jgi:hypothetical protein
MLMLIFGHSSLGTHRVSIGFLTRFHKGTMSVRIVQAPSMVLAANCASTRPLLRTPGRARPMARRLSASCKQSSPGCSHAPRPGMRRRKSTSASGSPVSLVDRTIRTNCSRASVCLQPMQVRTAPVKTEVLPPALTAFFTNCAMPSQKIIADSPWARSFSFYRVGTPHSYSVAASERMSIRQPVSLAARRAFCPSLPMAKDS